MIDMTRRPFIRTTTTAPIARPAITLEHSGAADRLDMHRDMLNFSGKVTISTSRENWGKFVLCCDAGIERVILGPIEGFRAEDDARAALDNLAAAVARRA